MTRKSESAGDGRSVYGTRRRAGHALLIAAASTLALTAARQAQAAPPPISIPVTSEEATGGQGEGPFDFLKDWRRNGALLGDMWGLRTALSRYGLSLAVEETSEVLGNVTGGSRRGFDYDGLTQAVLQLNTQRAFGWYGGTFNVSALQAHGRNLSTDNLQNLQTASGIEADRSTRLWEAWYDQKFLDEDRLDVKVGQQSLDQEFMVSNNALYFVNTMFGWPMLPSADLPGGGPAYPLSALGVRVRERPIDPITVLVGVFSGSPATHPNGDPQASDASGTSFPLNRGALVIAELQYSYPALGGMVSPGGAEPLARLYRLGAWYDTERFADLRHDNLGGLLADPSSSGVPRRHRGDYSIYAVADQMIWRSQTDPNRTLNVFARAMGAPLTDRNQIDFSMNAGLVVHDPFNYRTDDTFGLGLGYAHVGSQAAAYARDVGLITGAFTPPLRGETYVEATYQYQVAPWLQLQPDIQYVFDPGGGLVNPNSSNQQIKNELVLGARANVLF
jgi:porin